MCLLLAAVLGVLFVVNWLLSVVYCLFVAVCCCLFLFSVGRFLCVARCMLLVVVDCPLVFTMRCRLYGVCCSL